MKKIYFYERRMQTDRRKNERRYTNGQANDRRKQVGRPLLMIPKSLHPYPSTYPFDN